MGWLGLVQTQSKLANVCGSGGVLVCRLAGHGAGPGPGGLRYTAIALKVNWSTWIELQQSYFSEGKMETMGLADTSNPGGFPQVLESSGSSLLILQAL